MRWCLLASSWLLAGAVTAAPLRLIPTPAVVQPGAGSCAAKSLRIVVADPADVDNGFAAGLLRETLAECGLAAVAEGGVPVHLITARAGAPGQELLREADCVPGTELGDQGYRLQVTPQRIVLAGRTAAGTFYAVQTLRQLIRANRDAADAIPCVSIADRPAFPRRGYSDDISRGPFPTVAQIKRQIVTAAELKLNCLTWYVEHVFQVPQHPAFCPPGIGLSRPMIAELEPFARRYHVELIGGFQSFGHMWNVLHHEPYKRLGENPDVISPALEDSYQFLGEVYDAVAPSFSSPLFNICCDEVGGLGAGPAKSMVAKQGTGAVYAGHIKRLHALLKARGKRVMMWGDIVLQHPEQLKELPKDIVMLSWGYHPGESFDSAILPFKQSGFEFWVCPGVSCWSQMLPNHPVAMVNIHNYLRDGAKHGAQGVLNTTWDDDGENLFEANWYPLAWGAQCSWRPDGSQPAEFDQAWGPCFFGSPGDSAGAAVAAMAPAFRMAAFDGLADRAFWVDLFGPPLESPARAELAAKKLLACTEEAMGHLATTAAKTQRNQLALAAYRFGVQRVQVMAQNRLARLAAGREYTRAANGAPAAAGPALAAASAALQASRERLVALRGEYRERWLAECEPYWLDQMLKRWDGLLARYDQVLGRVDQAAKGAARGEPLPAPDELGLAQLVDLSRLTPTRRAPVAAPASWQVQEAVARLSFELVGRSPARPFYLAELALPASALGELANDLGRLGVQVVRTADGTPVGPGQLWRASDGSLRLAVELTAPVAPEARLPLTAYLRPGPAAAQVTAVPAKELPGGLWLENDQVRLLIGREGGHVFRWLVKALGDVDLTDPGDNGYHGFLDEGGDGRTAAYQLEVITQGPLLARVRAVFESDREKVFTLYRGQPVLEVLASPAHGYFWCFDAVANMAADTQTPGTMLFANGTTVPVPKSDSHDQTRVHAQWSAKYRADGLTLALLTPDGANHHVAGPGGGWGGVGLEGARPESHFVVVGGKLGQDRSEQLNRWCAATARAAQPVAVIGGWERR